MFWCGRMRRASLSMDLLSNFRMEFDGERLRVTPTNHPPQHDGVAFQAYNVPMQPEEEGGITRVCIPAMSGLTLPPAGGPSIMMTGQLSACSFVYQPLANGGLEVAHIQPGARVAGNVADPKVATSGMSLANNIARNGGFVGQGGQTVQVFGSNLYQHVRADDETSRCTVLGVRRANGWNLYAQIYTKQGRNVVDALQFHG